MRRMVEKLLMQYGMDMTLGAKRVRGLLQPVTGKLERLSVPEAGVLGSEMRMRFLYIGPLEPAPEEGQELTASGKRYHIRSAQQIWGNDGPAYSWAMCVEKGREDSWGMSF